MKKNKFSHKVIAVFLTLNFLTSIIPVNYLFANNNGPNAPEASGFEPVDATDMVNLSTGDTAYVLPLIDVGGFPVTLSYHSGIPLDMESSWVGLGWNINTGAIARGVSATPDDWSSAKTLDFIYFQDSQTFYSINVGIGISKAAEVGVGMSWGSNKSLSGSVFGSFAGISASISTDGSYSVGFGVGFGSKGSETSGVGAGISISGNINGGKPTVGLGVGGRSGNLTGSLGVSLSDSGASFSISGGYSNRKAYDKGQSGSGGISVGNYSSGDFDISSKGFYIPIQLGPFSLGFGKQKVTYTLKKGYGKTGYGILYANQAASNDLNINNEGIPTNHRFGDYQNRYVYTDMYDQVLPQSEGEFIADSQDENMKLNFSFAGYDSYEVNATGIAGGMKPKVFENATLFGLGYKGSYPNSGTDEKMRIYNHNSSGSTNYLPTKSLGGSNNFVFYFDGQFTQKTQIAPLNYTSSFSFNTDQNKTMKDYLPTGKVADNNRKKSGNYVEVFTNYQIRTGQATGLLEPEGLPHTSRTNLDYKDSGIGGYKITAPDGKIYHFALPVYNYERVERTNLQNASGNYVNEKRQYTAFATHWLLTAITGPDFVDTNSNNFPDANDYGYWVRLDHGKWSNAYTWRSPYNGVNYSTNELGKIGTEDFGNYQYGRKDLYYLDKIVTQTHTAYFVKDIRYDATGATTNGTNNESSFIYSYNVGFDRIPDNTSSGGTDPWVRENGITYKREYQLLLDKIVIVPSQFDNVQKDDSYQTLNSQNLPGYIANDSYQLQYNTNPDAGFYAERNARPTVYLHQEEDVYDIKDFANFDYSKAIKTIQLKYDYELATGSPSSYQCYNNTSASNPPNTNKGKLSLKSVQFLGRNLAKYMPPYKFDYKGSGTSGLVYPMGHNINDNQEVKKAKDEWGFIDEQYYLKNYLKTTFNSEPGDSNYKTLFNQYYSQFANSHGPDNWSLKKITTPTGSTINFEYEEDDYYIEAFARRYWVDNLKFRFRTSGGFYYIDIENDTPNIDPEYFTEDFTDYFKIGDYPFIDLSFCARGREDGAFHDIDNYKFLIDAKELEVQSVSTTQVVLKLSSSQINFTYTDPEHNPFNDNDWYSYTQGSNVNGPSNTKKGKNNCPAGESGGFYHHSIYYKLLASKVPNDQTGGGLRVKSITLEDESNNKYHTKYYYNQPGTYKEKNVGTYKSSGITSFAPVNGLKFVPYQSELPGAGVMYEYVTMVSESDQGIPLGETRYRFYTLQPVKDIFDPNLTMYDDQGKEIFNATVENANNHSEGLLHNDQKVYAKKINIDVNTSLVGQFRSIEEFNNEGHLLKKTEKSYLSGVDLASYSNRGYVRESFQSMKSIFKANSSNQSPVLQKRLLSLSSRRDYNSVLSRVTTTTQFGKNTEIYSNADPETGAFRRTETTMSDGTKQIVEKIPAYEKYPLMGSKVTNPSNKNMLVQEAMSISKLSGPNAYGTLSASITTWNKDWTYRDEFGMESSAGEVPVWRKHKTYLWKDEVNATTGAYNTGVSEYNNYFNWGAGTPTSSKWQNISEITRYTHWSSPIETKDINGNFASSKMADNFSKTVASGNARYTEMYYSGAENMVSGNNFDGEVLGANFRQSGIAHTGDYSVKTNAANDKVFEILGNVGANSTDYTKDFRPGKYKVSFWMYHSSGAASQTGANLKLNGTSVPMSESVEAGSWKQYNYYVDLIASSSVSLYVTNTNGGNYYFDDFRLHPVYTSMNSYVYDKVTDELLYILDANNMATRYVYDAAGRLCKTYVEVPTQVRTSGSYNNASINSYTGGFKLINENKYHYQSMTTEGCGDCCNYLP
ncbi:hypothetical protein CJ739_1739 [Mariniflexile rhizosphaerae]|uniref:hypothetical protein n=1 Tax=unclassified Mariniflexile TaxID=2643887 RepID=UPI000E330325|nr:hypothetical protein [Mariniflexile sp. TRM1-10]AXP80825.1 hypothetical protein CJ739_1739 [Mariniflexile sp. TRM1-10]